jgi:RNA polymerase sigma-70 factor (ECF subfamily)
MWQRRVFHTSNFFQEACGNRVDLAYWLYSVVANHCRMVLRRRKRGPASVEASEELLDALLASAPAPDKDEESEQEIEALTNALTRVGEGQRRCIELFYLEGHSYAEVARRSGYTANEVKSHIQNGKRSLRILLQGGRIPGSDA